MILTIDLESDRPLYQQIADAVRRGLVKGNISPGEHLPSGRELASTLDVNLETVQRAYRQLAKDGLVSSRVGRGTRIADSVDVQSLGVAEVIDRLVIKAGQLGLSRSQIVELIDQRFMREMV